MRNISGINNCYGCGVCAIACPVGIISVRLNNDGFLKPYIDEQKKCTGCRACLQSCAYMYDKPEVTGEFPETFSGFSRAEEIRYNCSSGGVSFELLKMLMAEGFRICAVRYNVEARHAEHYIADDLASLKESMKSKYIQSHTLPAFRLFNRKDRFAVVGTPCQIDSLRRFIKRHQLDGQFILIDFLCHGVPSHYLWQKYLELKERKFGHFRKISWRDKRYGWRKSFCMRMENDNDEIHYSFYKQDPFYHFFLPSYFLNSPCYHRCKYKLLSSAGDIRLGDLWGIQCKDDQRGVNGIIALTNRGKQAIRALNSCEIKPIDKREILRQQMEAPAKEKLIGKMAAIALRNGISLQVIFQIMKIYQFLLLPTRACNKLRSLNQ